MIGNPWALPPAFPTPTRRRIRTHHLRLRGQVVALLEQRARHPQRYDDLATRVLAGRGHDKTITRTADQLIGSLLAAQRVPAAAAGWLLMLAAHRPDWQARAAEDEAVARRWCRVTTALSARVDHHAHVDARCGDRWYRFESGHNFLISPYVMHRDPTVFVDPEAFRPPPRAMVRRRAPAAAAYLPFGLGRHRCPGINLASVALVGVLRAASSLGLVERVGTGVTPDARTTLLPRGLRSPLSRPRPP